MEELDLLKKDWNKTDNYPKVSENDIYQLKHKNSSSTVKWIFIISILELTFGIVLNVFMSFTKYDSQNTEILKRFGIYEYYKWFAILLYIVVVYFIARFYIMYRKVSTTDNTKSLMKNILKTRKTVQNYILFNLVTSAVVFVTILTFAFNEGIAKVTIANGEKISDIPNSAYIVFFLVILVVTGVLCVVLWLFYKLLYGRLLRKLKVNFEELKKIDL
jgi:Na+/H+ antiporter NhaC